MGRVTYVKFRSGGKSFIGLLLEIQAVSVAGHFITLLSIRMNDNTIVDAFANQIEREATPEEVFRDYMEFQ